MRQSDAHSGFSMPIAIGLEPSASALLSRAVPLPHGLDGYAVSFALSSDVESLFVSRLRLTAACLLMGALGGLCVVVGFQSQWKEPLPDLLRALGLFVILVPVLLLGAFGRRFAGIPLLHLKETSVVVGSREIARESIGGWILVHSSRGMTWPGGTPASMEHSLSAVYLVIAPPDATASLLWISSNLDCRSTRRIKRFLATHVEIVGEFDLDSVEGASGFAAVLDRVCGARHTGAVDLRDALKRVTEKKAANIDPQSW